MAIASINGTFQLGAGAITDQHCAVGSGAGIDVTKTKHAYYCENDFNSKITDAPVAGTWINHVCNVAGTVRSFKCMLYTHLSSGSITFDLLKNGVSILSAVVSLDNTGTDRQIFSGTLSGTSVAIGDVLTVTIATSTPSGGAGPRAWVALSENDAP